MIGKKFHGVRCAFGHTERYVSGRGCVACKRAYERTPARKEAKRIQNSSPKARRADRARRGIPAPTRPEPAACESCGAIASGRRLSADHCHVTRAFRGWLCGRCNTGIALLGDGAVGLRKALRYLEGN